MNFSGRLCKYSEMAWAVDDHERREAASGWRLSTLSHAFLELLLVLCVFLCAIISVTTTWLIKVSRISPPCGRPCCDGHDGPTIVCADCTLSLSDCDCDFKPASLEDDNSSSARIHSRSNVFSAIMRPVEDDMSGLKQQGYASSAGRVRKRKFAKVLRNNSRGSLGSNPAQVSAVNPSLIIGNGPAKVRDFGLDSGLDTDNNAQYRGRFSLEESSQNFPYTRRSSLIPSRSVEVSRNKNLASDSDLQGGEATSEWDGGFGSLSHEIEEEGSSVEGDYPDVGVMELREALREEQKVLALLYIELEEERNASSSAANEAMAMISRLQEEKAEVQMKARQYQRMAEEKQLYDQEAIALLQEILVRRDEEMYALEEEVNQYRERLFSLRLDELMDHHDGRDGHLRRDSDVLLIEREPLLLEGSDDSKMRRDKSDEKLLAEVKDWLHVGNEKATKPQVGEDLGVPENHQRLASKISVLPGGKNLLETVGSVVAEERSRSTAVVNEDAETPKDPAAGYEAFQGMMESLRQEPSLRDEESLETLKEIEEKFRKQSSKGPVRSEDELRQIWKNILRSFESEEGEGAQVGAVAESTAQSSTITAEPDVGGEENADRSMEEKRMSVLEYVWKFEEQLHQVGQKKPLQSGKSGLSLQSGKSGLSLQSGKSGLFSVEPGLENSPESKGASVEFPARNVLDSDKNRKSIPGGDRQNSVPGGDRQSSIKARLRKVASSTRSASSLNAEGDRLTVRREASSGNATSTQDARLPKPRGLEKEINQGGSSGMHDVYEVQQPFPGVTTSHSRKGNRFNHDLKKSSSAVESTHSSETARRVEDSFADDGDRLGKPDPVPGHALQESEVTGKGRPYKKRSGAFTQSVEEPGISEQSDARVGGVRGNLMGPPRLSRTKSTRSDVVQQLTHRLSILETDRHKMQRTISSLKREKSQMRVLQEIAQQLRGQQRAGHSWLTPRPPLPKDQKPVLRGRSLAVGDVTSASLTGDLQVQPSMSTLSTLLSQQSWPMGAKERSESEVNGWDY